MPAKTLPVINKRIKLLDDILVNDAAISDIRSVYLQGVSKDVIRYATVSNSSDGLAENLIPPILNGKPLETISGR